MTEVNVAEIKIKYLKREKDSKRIFLIVHLAAPERKTQ